MEWGQTLISDYTIYYTVFRLNLCTNWQEDHLPLNNYFLKDHGLPLA